MLEFLAGLALVGLALGVYYLFSVLVIDGRRWDFRPMLTWAGKAVATALAILYLIGVAVGMVAGVYCVGDAALKLVGLKETPARAP